MELKKSKNADLKSMRSSFLAVGLTVASSLTLMSFEYMTFAPKIDVAVENDEPAEIISFSPTKTVVQINKPISKPKVDRIIKDPTTVKEGEEKKEVKKPIFIDIADSLLADDGNDDWDLGDSLVAFVPILPPEPTRFPVEEATFPGGRPALDLYFSENIEYPQISQDNNSQGKNFIEFVIEPDGSVSNVKILQSVDKYIDAMSTEVISKMPKWKPGKNEAGTPIRTFMVLPINYKIE